MNTLADREGLNWPNLLTSPKHRSRSGSRIGGPRTKGSKRHRWINSLGEKSNAIHIT